MTTWEQLAELNFLTVRGKVIPWTVPELRPLADNVADHELNISAVFESRTRQKHSNTLACKQALQL